MVLQKWEVKNELFETEIAKKYLKMLSLLGLALLLGVNSVEASEIIGGDLPHKLLVRGNKRHEMGHTIRPNLSPTHRAQVSLETVRPFAAVVTSSNSGISPEVIFDQGIGDLDVIRSAGYLSSDEIVNSIEHSIEKNKVSHLVIMAQKNCPIIKKALSGHEESGHKGVIFKRIRMIRPKSGEVFGPEEFLSRSIQLLMEKSPLLRKLVRKGKLTLQGAIYDEATKKVQWIETEEEQLKTLNLPPTLVRKDPWITPDTIISKAKETENENPGEHQSEFIEVRARSVSPAARVVQSIKRGNMSFAAGKMDWDGWQNLDHPSIPKTKAVVFTRSSSLLPVEYVIGGKAEDVFIVRNSELKLSQLNIAGLEYGIANLDSKVLVILDVLKNKEPQSEQEQLSQLNNIALEAQQRSIEISSRFDSEEIEILLGLYETESGVIDWHLAERKTNFDKETSKGISEYQTMEEVDSHSDSAQKTATSQKKQATPLSAADKLLSKLKAGNKRFVEDIVEHNGEDGLVGISARKHFQTSKPEISILYPSDLYIPVATIFDQKPGTFFKVNLIGGIADEPTISSLEVGINKLNTPLVIFLGHDSSLAFEQVSSSSTEDADSNNPFLKKIKPVLVRAGKDPSSYDFARESILQSMIDTLKLSRDIRQKFHEGEIDFVGALYNSESGIIDWIRPGDHKSKH